MQRRTDWLLRKVREPRVLTNHARSCKRNAQYLEDLGYTIIIQDCDGRALKPDILAVNPTTKQIMWVEILNRKATKEALREVKKLDRIEKTLMSVGGVLKTLYADTDELIEVGDD